jgi:hypothetical protein
MKGVERRIALKVFWLQPAAKTLLKTADAQAAFNIASRFPYSVAYGVNLGLRIDPDF